MTYVIDADTRYSTLSIHTLLDKGDCLLCQQRRVRREASADVIIIFVLANEAVESEGLAKASFVKTYGVELRLL